MPRLHTAAAAAAAPGCAPLRSEPAALPCLPCPAPPARLWPLLSPLPSLLWTQQVRPAPLHCPASWLVAQRAAGGLWCAVLCSCVRAGRRTGCGLHICHRMPRLHTAAAAAAAPGCAPLRSEPVPLPRLPCPAPSARLWPLLSPLPPLLWTQQVRPAPLHCLASWLVAQRAAGGLCCSCAVCMRQRRALHWLWAAQPVVAAGSLHLSTPSGFLLTTTSHR